MDEKLKPILQKARRIVRTFRKSNVATEELLKVTELTLVADVSTRWNSTLLFLKRLDLLKDAVQDSMVKHLKIPSLTPGEWMIIKYVIKLLDKFNTVSALNFDYRYSFSNLLIKLSNLVLCCR